LPHWHHSSWLLFAVMSRSTDIVDIEEALTKTGPELFKELFRIYPVADAEDYFKAGQWRDDIMKADIVLMESHRRECGAPDVPDLDDIKIPYALPQQVSMQTPGFAGPGLKFVQPGSVPALSPAGSVAGSAPVVEIRLIALFVAKWKFEPVTAKAALAKLTPTHRRFVIQRFKTEKAAAEATAELEEYIAKCEADKSWDAPGAAANGAGAVTAAPPKLGALAVPSVRPLPKAVGPVITPGLAGLKRPMLSPGVNQPWAQNKFPKMLSPAGVRPGMPTMMRPQAWPVQPKAWGW